ncbi:hypothetical protein [Candidatus Ferrigenium straubiae]|uniref:hypothetical protein n=1 Tax=Candidatus Ferrigenium straubiae TaxID=2919506 RepID=UPI003F4AD202
MMKTVFALLTLATIAGTAVAATDQQNTDTAKSAATPATKPAPSLPAGHMAVTATPSIPLTHKGKVLEVIDSPMYTYLQVTGDKEPVWLAAYKNNITKGTSVEYSDGVVMNKFFSKSLNRTFDTIIFVDSVVPAKK